jgi:hypothetical protein
LDFGGSGYTTSRKRTEAEATGKQAVLQLRPDAKAKL